MAGYIPIDETKDPLEHIKKNGLNEVFFKELMLLSIQNEKRKTGKIPNLEQWLNRKYGPHEMGDAHVRALDIQDYFIDLMNV